MSKELIGARFEPIRLLGEGGASEVLLVRDAFEGQQRYALKRLPVSLAHLAVEEFRRLCSFAYPGIPRAHELGIDPRDGSLFFTAEYLEGSEFLAGLANLPLDDQLDAVGELLRTLTFLHRRGLVHRDLKPANVLVRRDATAQRVMLIDFGLAGERFEPDQVSGSLPYMAPEVLDGTPCSPGSDLYSLGIMLYELWFGSHPFRATTPLEWVRAHREASAELPEDLSVPAALGRLVQRLLAKDPAQRYPSAAAVLTDLSRLSVNPIPRETEASFRGRIRSVPPPASQDVRRWFQEAVERCELPLFWVHASTRKACADLARELRAEWVGRGRAPLHLRLQTPDPLGDLTRQVSLLAEVSLAPGSAGEDLEELVERLEELPVALHVEDLEEHVPEEQPWLRLLLRARLPVVVSSRTDPGDHPLGAVLREDPRFVVLKPPAFTTADLEALFPQWLGFELPEGLAGFVGAGEGVEASRLVETLTFLVDCGALSVVNGVAHVNLGLADLSQAGNDLLTILQRRLALLPPEDLEVLTAFAVLDSLATIQEAEALLDAEEPLSRRVWALGEQGFLEGTHGGGGEHHRIASGAVRDAVLSAASAGRVRELHSGVCTLAAQGRVSPRPEAVMARHAFRGLPGPESSAAMADAVESLNAESRFPQAQELIRELREGCAREGLVLPAELEARLQFAEARSLLKLGSARRAVDLLEEASRAVLPAELGERVCLELAVAYERTGQFREALAAVDRVGESSDLGAEVLAQRAFLLYRLGRDDEAVECCRRADALLPRRPTRTRIRVHNTLGLILSRRSEFEASRRELRAAVQLAARAGNLIWKASAQHNLARLELECGRCEAAVSLLTEGQKSMRLLGDRQMSVQLRTTLALARYEQGLLQEAKEELDLAREELQLVALGPQFQRWLCMVQAQVALAEGELEVADGQIELALHLAGELGDVRGAILADLLLVERCLRGDEKERARKVLDAVLERQVAEGSAEVAEYATTALLAYCGWVGTEQEIEDALHRELPRPAAMFRQAAVAEARARVLWRAGRREELVDLVDEIEPRLVATDLVGRLALLRAFRAAARGEVPAAEKEAVRRSIERLVEPGHRERRAEALCLLGRATGDPVLFRQALRVAEPLRHRPLERAIRELGQALGSGEVSEQTAQVLASLQQLKEVTKVITREVDGDRLLRLLLDNAIEKTGAKRGFLILLKGNSIAIPAARNIELTDIENPEFSVSSSVARATALEGRPYVASDARADERFRHASSISQLKLQSILCVPLRSHEKVIGALYLDDPTRVDRFDENDLSYVVDLSDHAAIALEKAQLLRDNIQRQKELERSKKEIERLNHQLNRRVQAQARELTEVKESLRATRAELSLKYEYPTIITRSPKMAAVLAVIDRVTDSSFPVYIFGESGTGKELIARAIHRNGMRSSGPYFSVNCATISPTLIETELFGYAKGAFTGADRDRPGYFELADGGTLLLDEIADASLELQSKLLRAIQFGEILRVGSDEVRRVDVRVVSASNRELQKEVQAGRFREDLYYRLNVHRVELPPLRERPEDVPLLIEHFQEKHAEKLDARKLRFQRGAMRLLMAHEWTGNVRELENVIIDLLVRRSDAEEVGEEDLPPRVRSSSGNGALPVDGKSLREHVEEREREVIRTTLERCGGVRARAARDLGMSERNLYKKLAKYGFL